MTNILTSYTKSQTMGGVVYRRLLLLFCSSTILSCINRFDEASSDGDLVDIEYNITIERLHQLVTATGYYDVKSDLTIQGNVTATDESGNFYKSFIIEQGGYAVEVLEGMTYSYVRHEEGYLISVDLNGLRLARSRGVLQVGLAASESSYYDLDYLEHEYIVDQHIVNSGYRSEVTPKVVSGVDISNEDFVTEFAGSLIAIGGMSLVTEEDASGATLWGGSLEFIDPNGNSIECYTSDYSDFSMCEVPSGELTLCGILQFDYNNGASSPTIKLRRESDCVVEL